jgi:tRNA-uridine 2-sulfurtransferase
MVMTRSCTDGDTAALDRAALSLRAFAGRRILVAMSGGVDSAVAAGLLRHAGADVVGVHMRVWHYEDLVCETGAGAADDLNTKIATCCSPADANDARRVAERLDFPFYSIDFQADFRRAVIDPFVQDYLGGRTPNPCVHCNTKLKLGTLLAKAKAYGCEAVATGHYGRVRRSDDGRMQLLRSADPAKDQTYYLFELRQAQLEHLLLPLGELDKSGTRAIARELGLELAEKPESQDICFVTDNDYRRFLREDTGLDEAALAGAIVDTRGNVLGRHEGIHNFTIGQRRGIGIAAPHPLYVVELLPDTRTVVVGEAEDLRSPGLIAYAMNWVAEAPLDPGDSLRVRAQIRYRHAPVPATLTALEGGKVRVDFDRPERAITPGQALVCYDEAMGEAVLCGGWIEGPAAG